MNAIYTKRLLLSVWSLLVVALAAGEGTREVMSQKKNGTGLIVSTSSGFPLGNVGSYLPASGATPKDQRIFFRIKDYTTESLYYGFNWETLAPSLPIDTYDDVYMNIYNPLGVKVATIRLPVSGNGFISSWNDAFAGCKVNGSGGYDPLIFNPAMNGDYYVNFYRSSNGGVSHDIAESMLAKYFDMTVIGISGSTITRNTGRIHCNEWAFSVYNPNSGDIQDPLSPTNAQFFTYTPDSVVAKVYFPPSGFQPLSYIVAFNSFGVLNNGNWLEDRKSIYLQKLVSPYLTGGYDVFLNQPDTSLYPTCKLPLPPELVTPVISGCPPGPYNIRFKAPQAGDYYFCLDLNGVSGYQANSKDRFIELISQQPGVITYAWDGLDGQGNPVASNTTFPITFSFRKGRINIPFYDVELNKNGFNVIGVAPQNAIQTVLYWDDSKLKSVGTECNSSNNNNYTGIGYDNSIAGQITPGHAWNGDGNPNFLKPALAKPDNGTDNDKDNVQCNDFGNARLINTWAWGVTLSTTQNLTLACINVHGTVWDDADNSAAGTFANIQTNSEAGVNAGGTLFATLIDPVTGRVMMSAAVQPNGKYDLSNCPVGATGMMVVISTTKGVYGNTAPAGAVPSSWIATSPLVNTFSSGSSDVYNVDFGIEQLPNSTDQHYTIATPVLNSFVTLNGAGTIASPGPLKGSDPEDGILGSGKTVVITQIPSNEQLYYNNNLVANNTKIVNYDPNQLKVKYISITVQTTSFQYAYIDAAGKQDPTPATYIIETSSVLATTLTSFTGSSTDQGGVLDWLAERETGAVSYVIERSSDNITFNPIGHVHGRDGGNGAHRLTDPHPTPGVPTYYRLKWTDGSGATAYSNIVILTPAGISSILEVAPNPFRDAVTIRISLAKAEKVSVRLFDSKGMVLRTQVYPGLKGENLLPVTGLHALPISVYFIQVVVSDQTFVKKVFNH